MINSRWVVKFRLIPILLFSFLVSPVYAASFDCSKATTETEKAICADPHLSALDELMAEKFLSIEGPKPIDEQRSWLSERNKCDDKDCLRKAIINRISQIDAILDGFPEAFKEFHCEIKPTQFKVYSEGGAYGDWFMLVGTNRRQSSFEVEWNTHGSGACRYWSYEFEVNGEVYNLDQLDGCSGPDAPIEPNGAIGILSFGDLQYFCFDPYRTFPND